MLKPGQIIRPSMTEGTARRLVEELYGFKVTSIKEFNSYDDKNYKVEVAAEFNNPNVEIVWPDGYVLKVLNSMDTSKEHVAAEHEVQALLRKAGIQCPQPVLNREGRYWSRQKIPHEAAGGAGKEDALSGEEPPFGIHTVRLLTFITGDLIADHDATPDILEATGAYLARILKTIKDFSHPALTHHETVWNLIQTPKLAEFMYATETASWKKSVEEVIEAFNKQVLPNVDKFQKGIIHGDFNEQNVLVKKNKQHKFGPTTAEEEPEEQLTIAGVLDFGDITNSYQLFDIAIAIMYMSITCKTKLDPLQAGGHVLSGYLQEMSLNEDEWKALRVCVAARYCQSLVMGNYSYSLDPGNEYLLITTKIGQDLFERFWRTSKEELYLAWFSIIRERQPDVCLPSLDAVL